MYGLNDNKHYLTNLEKSGIKKIKIRIPSSAKRKLLEDLQMLGKTVDNIYPDWRGISDYFASFYGKSLLNYYEEK